MSRVKVKKIKQEVDTGELNGLFDQMMGAKEADPDIIRPKYITIKARLIHILKVLNHFEGFNLFWNSFPNDEDCKLQIKEFLLRVKENTGFSIDTDPSNEDLKLLSTAQMNSVYKRLKDDTEIKSLIEVCACLKRRKQYIEDIKNLDDKIVKREPGLTYFPLKNITDLDFKLIWATCESEMIKKYLLTILSHIYNDTMIIYDTIMSPDVDIKKLSETLVVAIDKVKKQIPRCNRAFRAIQESVSLLENNFDKYWVDSVEAQNPSVILECFVSDVSKSQKTDPELTRQFGRIISHLKKMSTGRQNDPRVQSLFRLLGKNFKMMEEQTPGYNRDPDSKDDDSDEPTQEDINNLMMTPEQVQESFAPNIYKPTVRNKKPKKKK